MPEKSPHPRKQSPGKVWRWKRTVVMALLLLIGGAVVNVAAAWGFAAWVPMRKWSQTIHGAFNQDDQTWRVLETRQWGATQIWWAADIRYDARGNEVRLSPEEKLVRARRQVEIDSEFEPKRVTRHAPPTFGSFHRPIPPGVLHGTDRAFGWPQRSLWNKVSGGGGLLGFGSSARLEGGLRLDKGPLTFDFRALPLWPLFPGFIVNTLFYALLLWLLFFAPFTARRMLRRRRGQCEKCAYPIGVSAVCTECGAAVRRS